MLALALPFLAVPSAYAQSRVDKVTLDQISTRSREALSWSTSLLVSDSASRVLVDSSGATREMIGLKYGRPFLYTTHNRRAATTSRTHTLWTGGRSGYDLMGAGQAIGVWDAGVARSTHVELAGRVAQKDTTSEGQNHATHVAGTIAASGDWDIVRGMAPASLINAYNWNGDVEEMAAAAAEGLTISNHSYGTPLGWTANIQGDGLWGWMGDPSISPSEDFRFGWYDEQAALWDELAVAAPEYLIIKSAGNEREWQGPTDGAPHWVFDDGWKMSSAVRSRDGARTGYDTIGDSGVSKNVLTVGAVESAPWEISTPEDVVMTTFSSWGPTDDGRIKPDLVAPGLQLMSSKAGSDTAYGPSSGTSMAAPVVSGSASLLQELYAREFGDRPPLSSSLKGLLLHTADEAGRFPGPDYEFGWGHLNSEKAARHIRQTAVASRSTAPVPPYPAQMLEASLLPSEVFEWPVTITETGTFRATLVWTDPAHTVSGPALNDPSLHLVHDLNMVVLGPDGTHYPWTLDPFRPAEPAEKGINIRDNVEQVHFRAEPGAYTVRISAPANLQTNAQWFSLLIGEAQAGDQGNPTHTLSGTVKQESMGIQNVRVRIQGPVWKGYSTLKDGVFLFSDLPDGTYTIIPENPLLTFSPTSAEVTLPLESGRVDFEAIPPLQLLRTRLFESTSLLSANEQQDAIDVETAAAGGVYGMSLVFSSDRAADLNGLQLHLDTSFDPRVTPFSGHTGTYWLDESPEWPLSAYSSTRLSKRIPAIWFSGEGPLPREAVIPFTVQANGDQVVYADTIRITVDRPDDMAPIAIPSIRLPGLSFANPGESLEIRAGYLDGSAVSELSALLLDRTDESRILHTLALKDSGDLSADFDVQQGDGLYTARFRPTIEAEYRLALLSKDVSGNEHTQLTDAYFSSKPFSARGDVLFLTSYERGSRTSDHEDIFDQIGFTYSHWDFLTRGLIPESTLNQFPYLVWSLHSAPLHEASVMELIEQYLDQGGRLLFLAEDPSTAASEEWLERVLGVRFESYSAVGEQITGNSDLCCTSYSWGKGASSSSVQSVAEAEVLLVDNQVPLAVRSGQVMVSSVSAASLQQANAREELMSRFLYLLTQDESTIRPPEAPTFSEAAYESNPYENTVRIGLIAGTWTQFEIQLSTDAQFADIVELVETTDTERELILPFGATYFARARTVNPRGASAWSETVSILIPPANLAPISMLDFPDLELKMGTPSIQIDLSLHFRDPDGTIHEWNAVSDTASILELSLNDSLLTIGPTLAGTTQILVSVIDNAGAFASSMFNVTVLENNAPIANDAAFSGEQLWIGRTLLIPLEPLFSDSDGDLLSFSVVSSNPSIILAERAGTDIQLTPASPGKATISITASDNRGAESILEAEFLSTQNHPPEAETVDPIEVLPGDLTVIPLHTIFSDPDNHPIVFGSRATEASSLITENDTLNVGFTNPGAYTVSITATDSLGASTTLDVVINVRRSVALWRSSSNLPLEFGLKSLYPQPFRNRVTFELDLPDPGHLSITLFDINGREIARVANQATQAGRYNLKWQAQNLPGGSYFYRILWNENVLTGSLVHIR